MDSFNTQSNPSSQKTGVFSKLVSFLKLNKDIYKSKKPNRQSLPTPLLTFLTALIANVNLNYFNKKTLKGKATESINHNEQDSHLVRTKVKIFELSILLIYTLALFLLEYDQYDDNDYKFQEMIKKVFQPQNQIEKQQINLENVFDEPTFWYYINNTLLKTIYLGTTYGDADNTSIPDYIYPGNQIIGTPSLTQRRVNNMSCTTNLHERFGENCHGSLDSDCSEETEPRKPINETDFKDEREGWHYKHWDTPGYSCNKSLLTLIDSDISNFCGYTITLNKTLHQTQLILEKYRKNGWIDTRTRLIAFRMIVLNVNTSIYCLVSIVFNFHTFGYVDTSINAETLHFINQNYTKKLIFFIIFTTTLFYHLFVVIFAVKFYGKRGAYSLLFTILGLLYFVIHIYYYKNLLPKLKDFSLITSLDKDKLTDNDAHDFSFAINFKRTLLDTIWAMALFSSFFAIYTRYFGFNVITTYFCVFSLESLTDRFCYLFMAFLLYISLGLPAHFLYGTRLSNYKTPLMSMMTLFRFILGDVFYKELENVYYSITIVFFVVFMILIFFIFININLAFINYHYNVVYTKYAEEIDIDVVYLIKVMVNKFDDKKKSNEISTEDSLTLNACELSSSKNIHMSKDECRKRRKIHETEFSSFETTTKTATLDQPTTTELNISEKSSELSSTIHSFETEWPTSSSSSQLSNLSFDTSILKDKTLDETSVEFMQNKDIASKLIQLVKKDFGIYNENHTISSKIKKTSTELKIFCTKNELIIYFRTHLFASNRKLVQMFKNFQLEHKKVFHLVIIHEIIEYYINTYIMVNSEKQRILNKYLNKFISNAHQDGSGEIKANEDDEDNSLEELDKIYASLTEYETLKSELSNINLTCSTLYKNLTKIITNLNDPN